MSDAPSSERSDGAARRFYFAGGFDCCPAGFDDTLLGRMVESVGGVVHAILDESVDVLVIGGRRKKGKREAERRGHELVDAGHPLRILDEPAFLALVRAGQPAGGATGLPGLVSHLHGTVDEGKLKRAITMLRSEAFQLHAHVSEARVVGVVRSQSSAGSVYSSWLRPDGSYGCSTPELEDCMGMGSTPCKHLLVLVVGLTRAGQLDAAVASRWIDATLGKRPRRDEELAAETFLQYRGAQSGELDWRPTETIPEDYYAL